MALEYTLQHPDTPVLWDLRELELNDDMWIHAAAFASAIVNPVQDKMSSEKRVVVVADDVTQAGVELVLGRLTVPWEWKIFRDVDEAVRWLVKDGP